MRRRRQYFASSFSLDESTADSRSVVGCRVEVFLVDATLVVLFITTSARPRFLFVWSCDVCQLVRLKGNPALLVFERESQHAAKLCPSAARSEGGGAISTSVHQYTSGSLVLAECWGAATLVAY